MMAFKSHYIWPPDARHACIDAGLEEDSVHATTDANTVLGSSPRRGMAKTCQWTAPHSRRHVKAAGAISQPEAHGWRETPHASAYELGAAGQEILLQCRARLLAIDDRPRHHPLGLTFGERSDIPPELSGRR